MNTPEIIVKRREGTGKGIARRLRREGAVPAILYGPAIRERAQHLRARQIDLENRAVCGKLRAPFGSQGFARCVEALDEVRRRQGEWLAAESAGML